MGRPLRDLDEVAGTNEALEAVLFDEAKDVVGLIADISASFVPLPELEELINEPGEICVL